MATSNKEIVFIGMSRERTNFFDVFDLQGIRVDYRRVERYDSHQNLKYISVYFAQLKDMKEWNMADNKLTNINESIRIKLGQLPLCMTNYTEATGRDVHVYLTIDSIMIIEQAVEEVWESILLMYFDSVAVACPKAMLHYGTTVAVASQFGSISWQRMYKINKLGMAIAASRNIPIVDAFSMTQPLTPEPDVFPDTVHLYSETKLVGNYVSKTITMLQMRQACPNL